MFVKYKDASITLGNSGISVDNIIAHYRLDVLISDALIQQLVETFPILCVTKGNHHVLSDFAELVLKPNTISEILFLDMAEVKVGNSG